MAKINRSDVIQKAVNDLALSTAEDKVPTETLDKVQLTYDLNKRFSSFVASTASTATGTLTVTLPSVSTGGEIYLTSISTTIIKDATCDQATGSINTVATPDASNIASNLQCIAGITLTADAQTETLSLAYPLKLKAGTSITNSASYSVGTMSRRVTVTGFITSSF